MYHIAVAIYTTPLSFYPDGKEGKRNMATRKKAIPEADAAVREVPEAAQAERPMPDEFKLNKDLPPVGNPENTVIIGGELIEIKPMKLKYQRNRTAAFYHALELYPLPDLLAIEPANGQDMFGDGRDGDKALLDWLVAATDREELVRENYNEIDTDTVYRILEIFRRVNKIDEKEAKLKNAVAPRVKD